MTEEKVQLLANLTQHKHRVLADPQDWLLIFLSA